MIDHHGYSNCLHCRKTWDVVEPYDIKIDDTQGVFPLCKNCFSELKAEEIINYLKGLIYGCLPSIATKEEYSYEKQKYDIEHAIQSVLKEKEIKNLEK